jgi:hypothetical protein
MHLFEEHHKYNLDSIIFSAISWREQVNFQCFFTDLELADYCNLNRDIDKRILNDLLMSKMFLKYNLDSILYLIYKKCI